MASYIAFFESKWLYSDGDRMPIRSATARRVSAARPSLRAISQAVSKISRRVASRRSANLSRLGRAIIVRHYPAGIDGLSTVRCSRGVQQVRWRRVAMSDPAQLWPGDAHLA